MALGKRYVGMLGCPVIRYTGGFIQILARAVRAAGKGEQFARFHSRPAELLAEQLCNLDERHGRCQHGSARVR